MKTIRQDDAKAKEFASRLLGYTFAEPMIGCVVEEDGKVLGALILNNYMPGHNIHLTGAGRGAWDLRVVRHIARYCFARVRRVSAVTSIYNHTAIKALKAIGFRQEGLLRDYFADGDAVLLGLTKREQKLIKVNLNG